MKVKRELMNLKTGSCHQHSSGFVSLLWDMQDPKLPNIPDAWIMIRKSRMQGRMFSW
jgi:hypothetical protein